MQALKLPHDHIWQGLISTLCYINETSAASAQWRPKQQLSLFHAQIEGVRSHLSHFQLSQPLGSTSLLLTVLVAMATGKRGRGDLAALGQAVG